MQQNIKMWRSILYLAYRDESIWFQSRLFFEKWYYTSNKCGEITKLWRSIFVFSFSTETNGCDFWALTDISERTDVISKNFSLQGRMDVATEEVEVHE